MIIYHTSQWDAKRHVTCWARRHCSTAGYKSSCCPQLWCRDVAQSVQRQVGQLRTSRCNIITVFKVSGVIAM
jgi:hypothetical protein